MQTSSRSLRLNDKNLMNVVLKDHSIDAYRQFQRVAELGQVAEIMRLALQSNANTSSRSLRLNDKNFMNIVVKDRPLLQNMVEVTVLDCKGESAQNLAQEILGAIENNGFVYLKNVPALPDDVVQKAFCVADKFWKLDLEAKRKYNRPKNYETEGNTGYVGVAVEMLDPSSKAEIREAYNFTPHVDEKLVFPDIEVPECRALMVDFFKRCHTASLDIMRALAQALQLDPEFFTENHRFIAKGANTTSVRVLNYPPLPDDIEPGTVRCGAHSDYGTITLLFQDDIGGLQMLDRDGHWREAAPVPSALIVHGADLLENWTSGRIKAAVRKLHPVSHHHRA